MSAPLRALLDLPARSVPEVLEELCRLFARHTAENAGHAVPLARIRLRSGGELFGWPVKIASSQLGRVLVFQAAGGEPAVLHVELGAVEGVSVPADALLAKPAAPSRLELKRRFAVVAEKLGAAGVSAGVAVAWERLREHDDVSRALGQLADDLAAIVDALAREPMAVSAMKEKLRAVSVEAAEHPSTFLRDGTFRVGVALSGAPGRAALREALEQGL